MIISRTPLRMSFTGGGSDLPSYYKSIGIGAVVSTAVDKYVYVNVNKKFDDGIRLAYSLVEDVRTANEISHPIVRAAMNEVGLAGGLEITTIADIPSRGTGLGSSSAFTVGLLNSLAAYQGHYLSASELGRQACRIEIDLCGEPIGKQDQYASAYGGFNLIEFHENERVDVTPVILPPGLRETLERRIIVFYTGITRSASSILQEQSRTSATDKNKQATLTKMVELTYSLRDALQAGSLDAFGDILHMNWELKKSLTTKISTGFIDEWYERGLKAGAIGGKILGAGAGGFLMFYAEEDRHDEIVRALDDLKRVHFRFDPLGSRVIFYNPT